MRRSAYSALAQRQRHSNVFAATLVAGATVVASFAVAPASAASADVVVGVPSERPAPYVWPLEGEPFAMRGAAAVSFLKSIGNLGFASANAGLTEDELIRTLREDSTMFVSRDLMVGYADTAPTSAESAAYAASDTPGAPQAAVTQAEVFDLNSRPSSTRLIYLDFNGHTTTGTQWNRDAGVDPIISTPYDIDGNNASFSPTELANMKQTWERVAEDYAPYDVNVTTKDPGSAGLIKTNSSDTAYGQRVVVESSDWYFNAKGSRIGGIAYVGTYGYLDRFRPGTDLPAFVFAGNLGGNAMAMAVTVSHEAGHTLNLSHDGITRDGKREEYYSGHGTDGNGGLAWSPLMGSAFYGKFTQWSNGSYTGATQTQDDVAIIQGFLRVVPDTPQSNGGERVAAQSTTLGVLTSGADTDTYLTYV
ncbi:MAG: hypothetical protein ACI9ME_000979, partial [Ilumatobacter sp.]